jgi:aryl-alcohol dehydrogenase-like predicted oxidoreductase
MYCTRYGADWMVSAVDRFLPKAQEMNVHPVTLAVAWVGTHPAITAPIIGARNLEQLEDSLAAAEFILSPEQRDELSALTPHPGYATDRNEEHTQFNYGEKLTKK